jgi:tartrate-resistant acid phosphatase type 5
MKKSRQARMLMRLAIFVVAAWLILSLLATYIPIRAATIRLARDYQTVQAGINTAQSGDLVFASPGTHSEQLTFSGKTLTLASTFYTTGDGRFIADMSTGSGCGATADLGWSETCSSPSSAALAPAPTKMFSPGDVVRFAVIGDFGSDSTAEGRVAGLVNDWNPDFVVTTGDNNYPDGEASTIDANIGKYYSRFIGNYQGAYGPGSPTNRFWPSLGNHDWHSMQCNLQGCSGAYLDYFTLPGNERYYEVDLGLVHLFAVDSDGAEPNGRSSSSAQANWLHNALAASTSCFDVVYFHHPPYSSGHHGSTTRMRWPFQAWGADVVMSGHDHAYERIDASGFPYFVNGSGGASLYAFENIGTLPSGIISVVRYSQDHGAMLVTATHTGITYQFFNTDGAIIDELQVAKNCPGQPLPTFGYDLYLPWVVRGATGS